MNPDTKAPERCERHGEITCRHCAKPEPRRWREWTLSKSDQGDETSRGPLLKFGESVSVVEASALERTEARIAELTRDKQEQLDEWTECVKRETNLREDWLAEVARATAAEARVVELETSIARSSGADWVRDLAAGRDRLRAALERIAFSEGLTATVQQSLARVALGTKPWRDGDE